MREELIKLIIQSVDGCARNWAETIADYLLKNGVVVLPKEEVKMNYKKKLERFRKSLDCEIATQADPSQLAFLYNFYTRGEMTDEDCIEIRGYYNGLKVAMEILERILDTEE